MTTTATTNITRLSTIIVAVDDQDRALGFYRDILGFPVSADIPFGDGYRWVETQPPGTTTTVALGKPPEGKVEGQMTGITLETADIDALHADLKAAGVDVDAEIMRAPEPVPSMFWFRDVDGNTLLAVQAPAAG